MRVGTVRVTLHLPYTFSLKDKRRVIKSLLANLKNEFNISVAEIDLLDDQRAAALGIALVSNNGRFIQRVLDRLMNHIARHPGVLVEEWESELL